MAREPTPDFDAVLLAGGLARRLGGANKPALTVGGTPLIVRTARAVEAAGRLVIVGPRHPALPQARYVREDPPGAGPVPALRAGVAEVAAPWTVLLAADLPFLAPEHVAALVGAAARRGAEGAVFVDDDGRVQWLTGVWRTDALRHALDAYEGTRLRGVLRQLRPAGVAARDAGEWPPWADCDTPETLAAADRAASGPYDRLRQPAKGEMTVLEDWIDAVCLELGIDRSDMDRDLVLDLARDVAHGVARPAAPLTAYLIGLAVGRGAAARDAAARVSEMAESWKGDAQP
ncbi:NTP transferase domain-containing protein [Actinomadura rupiterrae]|uniref:NTP transferase domain-containing protein n=1 Tax=Actinomadura rupiterrae TaxID=559627 RepID=UPI0027E22CFF|nr:NTP transferase domain-containing protein [Actinomadura rupiterrae]MCP2341457.1 molybdopterin-guanine dinucleotide biosynthesis protein A [Actinomadura rupiterrae]